MKIACLLVLSLGLGVPSALAHGGQYQAPSDTGGPGGNSGGNSAPPTNPGGANTPGPNSPSSGPGGLGSRGDNPRSGGRPGGVQSGLDLGATPHDWESWWDANKDEYLDLRNRLEGPRSGQGPGHLSGFGRNADTAPTRRPDPSRVDGDVLPFLDALMRQQDDRDVIDSSVLAMARSAREESAELVIAAASPLLAHGELSVQTSATLALGVLGSPLAADALTELATDSSQGRTLAGGRGAVPMLVRSLAALSLGLLDDEQSVGTLCALIDETQDSDSDLKACAIVALGLMDNARSPEASRFLLKLLGDRKLDAVLKSYVPTALGKLCSREGHADPSVLPPLLEAFTARDTDDRVRQSLAIALGLLGEVGGEAEASPVAQALMDYVAAGKDAATRHFSFIALAEIGGRDLDAAAHAGAHAALQALLGRELSKPSTRGNRPWAALAAALYGRAQPDSRADFAVLVQQAYESEKDPSVRSACVLALGLLEVGRMAPAIFDDFQSAHDASFRGFAAVALGFLGYEEAAEALHAECRSRSITPGYRMQVATALGLLGDRQAVEILSETLDGAQTLGVSAAVAKALGLIGDESALGPLMAIASDPDKSALTRAFACVALGMVCEQTRLPWNQPIVADNNYNVSVPAISEVCDIL